VVHRIHRSVCLAGIVRNLPDGKVYLQEYEVLPNANGQSAKYALCRQLPGGRGETA